MESTQIWIVEQSSGSYDDYRSWPVAAFLTREKAKEWLEINNPIFRADIKRQEEEAQQWAELMSELQNIPNYWVPGYEPYKGGKFSAEYLEALKVREASWEGKAFYPPSEEWGYSLNSDSIPLYS